MARGVRPCIWHAWPTSDALLSTDGAHERSTNRRPRIARLVHQDAVGWSIVSASWCAPHAEQCGVRNSLGLLGTYRHWHVIARDTMTLRSGGCAHGRGRGRAGTSSPPGLTRLQVWARAPQKTRPLKGESPAWLERGLEMGTKGRPFGGRCAPASQHSQMPKTPSPTALASTHAWRHRRIPFAFAEPRLHLKSRPRPPRKTP